MDPAWAFQPHRPSTYCCSSLRRYCCTGLPRPTESSPSGLGPRLSSISAWPHNPRTRWRPESRPKCLADNHRRSGWSWRLTRCLGSHVTCTRCGQGAKGAHRALDAVLQARGTNQAAIATCAALKCHCLALWDSHSQPAGHCRHLVVPSTSAYLSEQDISSLEIFRKMIGQDWWSYVSSLGLPSLPATHATHESKPAAPASGDARPMGQALQVSLLVAPKLCQTHFQCMFNAFSCSFLPLQPQVSIKARWALGA